ncbi:FIG094713: hypothetical protein [hydrothermal vent metagenome]|uniref:Uncharacterized protein n=1 Tax=hydrothermal vent metagenome TaxID=652676 RepID=A0A3B0SAR8_9ZZZZ
MGLRIKQISLATAALAAVAVALPVMGQDSPQSLLPPGFGDPAPAPTPAPAPAPTPAPSVAATPPLAPVSSQPSASSSSSSSVVRDSGAVPDVALRPPSSSLLDIDPDSDLGELDDALRPRYYLPVGQRRSLDQIGVLTQDGGGLPADAFGGEGGEYLTILIKNLNGPIISRWGSILLRRTLLSQVDSPDNVNPANWIAERAWRLLLMGEADAARALVLKVDGGNYTPRLYEVAMQAHLAASDPAGICPFVPGGARVSDEPTWALFQPICASLSGEQSRATSLLRQVRRKKTATGIDYLLAEKTIGAGYKGRRAVTIKWDDIQYFNNWRYGLGTATGVEPPDRLYEQAGRHVQGWRVRAPMLSKDSRMKAADVAAAIGVLSNNAMVDLYSATRDDPAASDDLKARASTLRQAYRDGTASGRISAMRSLWGRSESSLTTYSAKILTARAAAKIPVSKTLAEDSSDLIVSMMTAGLDLSAVRWAKTVPQGSLGWGLLAVGSPKPSVSPDYRALDEFADNDESENQLKSQFLLAALSGLGRLDAEVMKDFSSDLDIELGATSKWTRAISSAARRGQSGTVALLAAVGMQGRDWTTMSPLHLFYITRSLKQVGLEAEARMIAAEALTRA